jgi:hypothetical protein
MAAPFKPMRIGAFGATGTGKTAWLIQVLRKQRPPRLVLWDFKHDPPLDAIGAKPYTSLPALVQAMKAPTFCLRYMVNHDADVIAQFEIVCRAVWLAGNVLLYVAELPEVTKPGLAPKSWKKLVNVGRNYRLPHLGPTPVGSSIYADAQRFNEVDLSFRSNLDVVHVGRLGEEPDAKQAARKLGCKFEEIMALPNLHYVERAAGADCARGVLRFSTTRKKN